MHLFTAEEMRAIDAEAVAEFKTPSLLLMENAGRAVAERAMRLLSLDSGSQVPVGRNPSVIVVCGKGNNGGDGFVAARHLRNRGVSVQVVLVGEPSEVRGDARVNFDQLKPLWIEAESFNLSLPGKADLIIDALLGTGVKGAPRPPLAWAIQAINQSGASVLAVDIPSGLDADTGHAPGECVRAVETVTFGGVKLGLTTGIGPGVAGRITVASICLPLTLLDLPDNPRWLIAEEMAPYWPARDRLSHKGHSGRVFVLAGAVGYAGAAALACEAALRSGAGLVTLGTPRSLVPTVAAKLTEAMTFPLPETDAGALSPEALEAALERAAASDAVVLGPGLGRDPRTGEFVREFIRCCPAPMVIDADGLFHLPPGAALGTSATRWAPIVTPHPGEMARLLGTTTESVQSNRIQAAREAAGRLGCVVALKGPGTVIAPSAERGLAINSTGSPALATGGTGDVLSGIMGASLTQVSSPGEAAMAAVFLHGLAGEIAEERWGAPGAVAGDVVMAIPEAMRRLRNGEVPRPSDFC